MWIATPEKKENKDLSTEAKTTVNRSKKRNFNLKKEIIKEEPKSLKKFSVFNVYKMACPVDVDTSYVYHFEHKVDEKNRFISNFCGVSVEKVK